MAAKTVAAEDLLSSRASVGTRMRVKSGPYGWYAARLIQPHRGKAARPRCGSVDVAGSKLANIEELRAGTIRVLFAFDPRRTAILLLGGDKRGQWSRCYLDVIPAGERIDAPHLAAIQREEGHPR